MPYIEPAVRRPAKDASCPDIVRLLCIASLLGLLTALGV